jgi:hypothetical protein
MCQGRTITGMSTEAKSNRRLTDGSNGYFCVEEDGKPLIQGEANRERVDIWVMCDSPVTVDKMFDDFDD